MCLLSYTEFNKQLVVKKHFSSPYAESHCAWEDKGVISQSNEDDMLIRCRECRKQVSDEAKRCPHCDCRGPSGRYSYRDGNAEIYVNENTSIFCKKCGCSTPHRDFFREVHTKRYYSGRGTKTCKVCGHTEQTTDYRDYTLEWVTTLLPSNKKHK